MGPSRIPIKYCHTKLHEKCLWPNSLTVVVMGDYCMFFSNQLVIDCYKSCFIPLLTLSRAITAGDKYLAWFRNFETTNQWIG